MENMDHFRERVEALERRTHMVERRLRWWRGIACGVVLLSLLSLALPSGKAADGPGGGMAERMATLEDKLTAMSFDAASNEVVITGANLRIVNGLRATETTNGLGNLIVGYNESRGTGADMRAGSHNVVVGQRHNFSRFGGLVIGDFNEISGAFASVSAGFFNVASGDGASVSGGTNNTARGIASSVSGGFGNTAEGDPSEPSLVVATSVSGGTDNTARGARGASVSGGTGNTASGIDASVSGGLFLLQEATGGWAAGSFGDGISGRFVSP